MKKHIFIIIFSIFILACNEVDENEQQEEVIEKIIMTYGSYESSREFDTISITENLFIYRQGKGYSFDENENFEKSIDSYEFFNISKSIDIIDFFRLDSIIKSSKGEYPGSSDEGVFILELILNSKTRKVVCGSDSIPPIIYNVKTKIYELHEKIKK